jgi:hypothetical protein
VSLVSQVPNILVSPSENGDTAIPVVELADEPTSRERLWLAAVGLGLITVLGIARWIEPTDAQGRARTQGTHQQIGLPPCTVYVLTGWPCPGCGLTTSFSHLMHGNVVHSLRANPIGTFMATLCGLLAPWLLLSAVTGRRLGIGEYSDWSCRLIVTLVVLLFLQWAVRLGLQGKPSGGPSTVVATDASSRHAWK